MVRMSFKWTNNTNVIRKIKQYEWQNGDGWVMFKLILTANCIKNVDRIDQTYLSMFFCIVLFRKIFWMIATFSWNEHRLFQTLRQLLLVQMSRLFLLCERWQQRMQRQCASMYAIYFFFPDIYSPCFKPHKHRTWTV